MNASIVLVLGSHAQECAGVLAGSDGVAIAATAFTAFPYFAPLRPVFIYACERAELLPWMKQAAGLVHADGASSATVLQGRVRGRGRGKEIRWGKR
jgi:hypothetical protein